VLTAWFRTGAAKHRPATTAKKRSVIPGDAKGRGKGIQKKFQYIGLDV
jgi:hypothetical protein